VRFGGSGGWQRDDRGSSARESGLALFFARNCIALAAKIASGTWESLLGTGLQASLPRGGGARKARYIGEEGVEGVREKNTCFMAAQVLGLDTTVAAARA
jgi:hypothetical protein